jgi:hypothetical protein
MNEQDYVFVYTRQQAIDDGVFKDVTEVAKKYGFKIPVAITTNLFVTHIEQETDEQTNNVYHEISCHKDRDTDSLLAIKINPFVNGKVFDVWAVVEAQSPTDPSPAINIMLPEDY